MSIFFTSDHHFGHAGALGFYRRPFASVAEMDRLMIERWNSIVGHEDQVWHLGDFAVRQRPERVALLLATLHGRKHLISGNNDDAAVTGSAGWETVQSVLRGEHRQRASRSLPLSLPDLAQFRQRLDQPAWT